MAALFWKKPFVTSGGGGEGVGDCVSVSVTIFPSEVVTRFEVVIGGCDILGGIEEMGKDEVLGLVDEGVEIGIDTDGGAEVLLCGGGGGGGGAEEVLLYKLSQYDDSSEILVG